MRRLAVNVFACLTLVLGAAALQGCARSATTASPASLSPASTPPATQTSDTPELAASDVEDSSEDDTSAVFAIIGDYGTDDTHEAAVARMVKSWNPSYVIALGDDYYLKAGGTTSTKYDESTGAYYGKFLKDITTTGRRYPVGTASVNSFFPALGNHDYSDARPSPRTYTNYFTLPGSGFTNTSGNERYYDFVQGPIHYFVLNSNPLEPDGTSRTSKQAMWLKQQMGASTSKFNVVFDHHPPYSSDNKHGSTTYMTWPFATWGADVLLSGHAHVYERVNRNGIVYFINGLGGQTKYGFRSTPVRGSKIRYAGNWGAQKAIVTSTTLELQFYSVGGRFVDHYKLTRP